MEQIQRKRRQAGTLGKYFYVFILPAFIVYLLFSIVPFLYTFYYSFTDYTDMNPVNLSFVGLKNYIKVFNTPLMMTAIKNSVIYAIMLTSLQTILALPLAVLLDKKLKTRNLLRAVFFFPAVFSSLIIGYLWNFIMSSSDYGLINNLLHQLGFGTFNFFTANRALFSVILTQAWQWTGWAMVIYLANLQSISPDLYEAADIDGANVVQKFFHITLPMLKPTIMFVMIISMINSFQAFDQIYIMTKGGPGTATQVVSYLVYMNAFQYFKQGYASAMAYILFIIIFVASIIQLKVSEKDSL